MIYTINTDNLDKHYKAILKNKIKLNAFRRLKYYPINTTEKLLNNYLKEHYQMTLLYACYLIVINSNITEGKNELVVSMTDKHLEKIARVITFGTGRILGSRIIPFIFGKVT